MISALASPAHAHSPSSPTHSPHDPLAHEPLRSTLAASGAPLWLGGLLVAFIAASAALWVMGVIKPGGLGKNARNVRAFPAWLWMCGAFIIYSGVIVGSSLAAAALAGDSNVSRQSTLTRVAGLAVALVVGIALIRYAHQKARRSGLQVQAGDLRRGLVSFVITIPFVMVTSLVAALVARWITGKPPDPVAHVLLQDFRKNPNDPWIWTMLGAAVFLGPIVEELIYRAFLQSAFLAAFKRAWPAIIATSVLFTAAHVGSAPPHALATLLVLSLGMGIAYERSGRLGVPILMHVLFNAANVAAAYMTMRG
jgi:membrane protease YdiL (CAAX protease family)